MQNSGDKCKPVPADGQHLREFIIKAEAEDFVVEPGISSANDFLDVELYEDVVKDEWRKENGNSEVVPFGVITTQMGADRDTTVDYKDGFSICCGVCSFVLTDTRGVVKHMRTHRFKTYSCCLCGVVLGSAAELARHLPTHKKEVPHTCGYCHHGFFRLSSLKSHNCQKKPKLCQHCGEPFRLKKTLKMHIREKHRTEVPKKRHCPHCDFSGWSGPVLNEHLRTHRDNKFLQCPHCAFQFSKVESLQSHLRIHQDEQSFTCPYCGIVFAKYGVVKVHMDIHKDRKVLQCCLCDYQSPLARNLRLHRIRNHRDKGFRCPHCDYTTSVDIRFKVHLLTHQGDAAKLHACSSCGYKTKYLWDLKRHVQCRHEKSPSYPCPHCDFAAASLCVLKTHATKHTEKLPPPDFLKIT